MSVYIENIGSQKIKYRDHSEVNFSSLDDYLLLAKKSISKFANNFYSGLSKKMLLDEDAISNIAYSIMMADWRYDENRESKNSTKKTRYSYRNQCALWAIQTYVTKNYKKKSKKKVLSLDFCIDEESGTNYYAYIDASCDEPAFCAIQQEETRNNKKYIEQIISTAGISEKQKKYLKMYYYEGMTFEQIGNAYSLTREAVRQSIKKAIATIQENINENVR